MHDADANGSQRPLFVTRQFEGLGAGRLHSVSGSNDDVARAHENADLLRLYAIGKGRLDELGDGLSFGFGCVGNHHQRLGSVENGDCAAPVIALAIGVGD